MSGTKLTASVALGVFLGGLMLHITKVAIVLLLMLARGMLG